MFNSLRTLIPLTCVLASSVVAHASDLRPNIVHIMVDDLGWQDVACYYRDQHDEKPFYETPNLDRFAERGIRFTQAYSPAVTCAPSRAAFLTGQYTPHNGVYHVNSDNGASHQMAFDNGQKVPAGVRPGSMNTFLNHGPAVAALSNTPFKNYKTSDYEGGIASPLIAWWPRGLMGKGQISHRLSHIADIMPTCLELAGVSHPAQFEGRTVIPLVGRSFVSELRGPPDAHDAHRTIAWPKAVRRGDWKLVMQNAARPELFHMSQDRNETKNLAAEFPERVQEMKKLHASIRTRLVKERRK